MKIYDSTQVMDGVGWFLMDPVKFCMHCGKHIDVHIDDHCPFDSTMFKPGESTELKVTATYTTDASIVVPTKVKPCSPINRSVSARTVSAPTKNMRMKNVSSKQLRFNRSRGK
jgi:hypothetical protein